jgi:hypothetical protein
MKEIKRRCWKMDTNKIDKLFDKNFDRRDNFKHIADYIVARHTTGLDEERKIDVSADTALGMALGEAITKNNYLLTGLAIGVFGTVATIGIGLAIRKKMIKRYGVILTHLDDETEGFMFVDAIDEETAKDKAKEIIGERFNDEYSVMSAFEMK